MSAFTFFSHDRALREMAEKYGFSSLPIPAHLTKISEETEHLLAELPENSVTEHTTVRIQQAVSEASPPMCHAEWTSTVWLRHQDQLYRFQARLPVIVELDFFMGSEFESAIYVTAPKDHPNAYTRVPWTLLSDNTQKTWHPRHVAFTLAHQALNGPHGIEGLRHWPSQPVPTVHSTHKTAP